MIGLLGSGGMSQMFRASDPRLGRDVAIKVLPSSTDAGLRERFSQEARAASALNHPNIVGVYDIGSHDGSAYIVSELVEGESLRAIVERGPVAMRKLLDIATQIADGVAAAHAAGIVQRDLKPEKIMVTRDGRVKILDFGLAKMQQAPTGGQGEETVVMNTTAPGMILRTVNYMSPEQARGAPVDYRSDQFSLGIVFYEMASGKQPFHRESTAQTMSAIIADDPDTIPAEIKLPVPLRWVMDRCLAKEPEARYSTSDLHRDLRQLRDRISEASGSGIIAAQPQPAPKGLRFSKIAGMILLPLAALAAGYGIARWFSSSATDLSAYRFTPVATEAGRSSYPKWSPDGKSVAYLREVDGNKQIFVRSLDNPTPVQLTHSKQSIVRLFWSPGEPRILYLSPDSLWSISLIGGQPERVVDRVRMATNSPDGHSLALMRANVRGFNNGRLEISSPSGAEPRPYPGSPFKPGFYYGGTQIQFSPDGAKIFFFVSHPDGPPEAGLFPYLNPDGKGEAVRVFASLTASIRSFDWLPDGRRAILGLSNTFYDGHLWIADFTRETMRQITAGTGTEVDGVVSPDGERIAYTMSDIDFDLVSIPLDRSPIRRVVAGGAAVCLRHGPRRTI